MLGSLRGTVFYSGFLPNAAPTNRPGALQACEGRVSGQQMVNRQEVSAWRRMSGKRWVHQFHSKRAKCVNIVILLFFNVIINILFHIFYLYLRGFFSLPCSTIIQTVVRQNTQLHVFVAVFMHLSAAIRGKRWGWKAICPWIISNGSLHKSGAFVRSKYYTPF